MRSAALILVALVACDEGSTSAPDAAIEPIHVLQTATFGPMTGTTLTFEMPNVTTGWFVAAMTTTVGVARLNIAVDRYWPMTVSPCDTTSLMAFDLFPGADGHIELTLPAEGTASLFVMEVSEYSMPPRQFGGPHQGPRAIEAKAGSLIVSMATSCDEPADLASSSSFTTVGESMGTAFAYYVPMETGTFDPQWSSDTVEREYAVLDRR